MPSQLQEKTWIVYNLHILEAYEDENGRPGGSLQTALIYVDVYVRGLDGGAELQSAIWLEMIIQKMISIRAWHNLLVRSFKATILLSATRTR